MAKDMAGLFLCGLGFEDGEFSRFGQPETRFGKAGNGFQATYGAFLVAALFHLVF